MTILSGRIAYTTAAFGAGLLYREILFQLARGFAGAGHGSSLYAIIAASPLFLRGYFWPATALCLPHLSIRWVRRVFVGAMVTHFVSFAVVTVQDGGYLADEWQLVVKHPGAALAFLGSYLAGQVYIWRAWAMARSSAEVKDAAIPAAS